jgi:hypothetical protein
VYVLLILSPLSLSLSLSRGGGVPLSFSPFEDGEVLATHRSLSSVISCSMIS